jgi:predicted ATPase
MWQPAAPFILRAWARGDELEYVGEIPAVRSLYERPLDLEAPVTFLVGENGSGKSTVIEAIAVAASFNPEGGSETLRFSTRPSHSPLHRMLELERSELKPLNGFFLRAESFFNVASAVEGSSFENVYERSLHEQSHGESFLSVVLDRFGPRGLYILDEPEAALSLTGALALMHRMHALVQRHSQFIIATHSPILLGYPDARICELGPDGIADIAYEDTEQFKLTRSFLENPGRFLRHLFSDDDPSKPAA